MIGFIENFLKYREAIRDNECLANDLRQGVIGGREKLAHQHATRKNLILRCKILPLGPFGRPSVE